jgi:hypothetical protein
MHKIKWISPHNFVFGESDNVLKSGIGKDNPILLEYQNARQGAQSDGPKEPVFLVRVKDDNGIWAIDALSVIHLSTMNRE